MTSTILYRDKQQRHLFFDHLQSSEISLLSNDSLHQWLLIIGIATVVLFVLILCIKCILKTCRLYHSTDLNKQNSISRKYSSRQTLSNIDNNSKRSSYTKVQCDKSTNYTRQMLHKYSNHEQIQDINYQYSHPDEISLISVHVV
ncbi:unnamed protein product [Rotaria sp. Silwood2]|nr:unnamed protein product [Rotaria sp. Silwood2]CAF2937354.1 unnamed protein product [Rotaria sp. Silwood2]CAF3131710.1 unnamed protein product [Rotaria sp. Silwood2]CAF3896226.1 unnamed protein product [Rotaria sp. Silwood2]CAF4029249.1 unnamed protein product [Rotaria sp. Silwood2]